MELFPGDVSDECTDEDAGLVCVPHPPSPQIVIVIRSCSSMMTILLQ